MKMHSPTNEVIFDAFEHIESNPPSGNDGTPSGFYSYDPFQGVDPFQTPVTGDPFTLSTSFDGSFQQDSDAFDIQQTCNDFKPFSADDPETDKNRDLQDLLELVEIEDLRDLLEQADVNMNEDVGIDV